MPDEGSLQIAATSSPPLPPAAPGGRTRNPSVLPGMLGAVLGLLGLIAGVAAWFRAAPAHEAAKPVYSEQQVADAKRAVCDAYVKGERAVQVAGAKNAESPVDVLPIAVNTRLAEVTLANHLSNELDANPAAPLELTVVSRKLTRIYYEIALKQLSDGSVADVQPLGQTAEGFIVQIKRLCP